MVKYCISCGKDLNRGYEFLETKDFKKYRVLKCSECMLKDTLNKVRTDPQTFKTIYDTLKSQPENIPVRRCVRCGKPFHRPTRYSKCWNCLTFKVVTLKHKTLNSQ